MNEEQKEITIGEFDYQKVLLLHINQMSKLTSTIPKTTEGSETFPNMTRELREFIFDCVLISSRLLEGMLSPYADDEFTKEQNEIKEAYKDKSSAWANLNLGLEKFGNCIKLMDRLNLLLDKTTSGEIK